MRSLVCFVPGSIVFKKKKFYTLSGRLACSHGIGKVRLDGRTDKKGKKGQKRTKKLQAEAGRRISCMYIYAKANLFRYFLSAMNE